ncbi:unnamed protein product [Lampetra planeri]
MAERKGERDEAGEEYELLDLAGYARRHRGGGGGGGGWLQRVLGRESGPIAQKYSVATQIAVGGAGGWCAGFVFQKVGKLAATAVGGGFLLLQIANHTGYVTVDWKRVERDVNAAKKQLSRQAHQAAPDINSYLDEALLFLKKNVVLTSGFLGGFLLGMAS